MQYHTVEHFSGLATMAIKTETGFEIHSQSGEWFAARKLIFATGIRDIMPEIPGFAACWGISVLHCPYCHGYEVRSQQTGVLGNGDYGFEFSTLISNWTPDLTLYTNGKSTLSEEQTLKLRSHNIGIVETEIARLEHRHGHLEQLVFRDGNKITLTALYARTPFAQHCTLPEALGCALTDDGYLKIDSNQKTTVRGIFACGDNTTRIRTVANAVATGTTAGMIINKELVEENF
jgi:thioredoxin reductase